MFMETVSTQEICVGVVKGHTVHQKIAAQHAADLEMLHEFEETKLVLAREIVCPC